MGLQTCFDAGSHLQFVDDDGYCHVCGYQDAPQTYRIEVRFDCFNVEDGAIETARKAAAALGGEVTEILDEDWNTVDG